MEGNLNKEMYLLNNKSVNFETQRLNPNNNINNTSNIINYNKSQKIMQSNKNINNNQYNLSNDNKIIRNGNNLGNKNIIIMKDGKRYVMDKIVKRVRREDKMMVRLEKLMKGELFIITIIQKGYNK